VAQTKRRMQLPASHATRHIHSNRMEIPPTGRNVQVDRNVLTDRGNGTADNL
jgi:hypothetical protein